MRHVPVAPLGELCTVVAGGTPSRKNLANFDGGIPWVKIGDMSQGQIRYTEETISLTGMKNSAAKILPPGTVLVSIFATIGKTAVLDIEAATNQAIVGVTPQDPENLLPTYLRHYLDASANSLIRQASGVAQLNINTKILKSLPIPLFPGSEQWRIAAVLDQAETLRAKRRKAIAHLEKIPQEIFHEMFGSPCMMLQSWPSERMGNLLKFLTSGSRGWAKYYDKTGDIFIRIQNLQKDQLCLEDVVRVAAPQSAEADRTRVKPGDVLLSITADLGRTATVPQGIERAYINQHLAILRTDDLAPRFLSAYLTSPIGQRQVLGRNRQGVKAGLNFDDIKSIDIPVPPLSLQFDFTARVETVERLRESQRAHLAELDALFESLQHRAFRGEL